VPCSERMQILGHIAKPGHEPGAVAIDVGGCAEAVVLEFEEIVGVVVGFTPDYRVCWCEAEGKSTFD
jgi:hypothetical protein